MKLIGISALLVSLLSSCATGGAGGSSSGGGSMEGSTPVNSKEDRAYKRAILKCYKTGGSRVVKIEGKLRCY